MRVVTATALVGLFVMTASAAAPVNDVGGGSPQQAIVVFHDNVGDPAEVASELASAHGAQLGFVYQHALKGFSATLSPRALTAIERDPRVAYVELDQLAHIAADSSPVPVPTGIDRINADQNSHLDIDGNDDLRVKAVVAVIDTGIDFQHTDLNVNTAESVDCSGGSPLFASCSLGAGDDDNGHGTHVAGTIGALDDGVNFSNELYGDVHVVGVAPGVEQWAIKVLRSDGSGYISWIVAGIDYVTEHASTVDVANMSLGCECSSDAMDTAITNSVKAGVAYAVAAGNSDKDASTFSPANHKDVITVSALADFDGEPDAVITDTSSYCRDDEDDTLANFSNFGPEVEVTAPGVCILSAWNDGGYNIISGTSMASPHAAGAAALLAASGTTDPATIRDTLISTGNKTDWKDDSGDGIQEPRIDVANAAFNPAMTGSDTGGGDDNNTAPVADDVPASGDEDTTISWTPSVSDADGDSLTCSIATQPANGSATVESDCSGGTYTPDLNYNGTDSFTYWVSDGSATDDGTVTVTINPINDAPVANDDSYSTETDTQLAVAAPGVLGNDTDVDGDSLTVSAVDTSSTSGTVTWASDGSFTYDPPADFTGPDSFGYTVSDPSGATDTGTVTINVGSATTMHVADLVEEPAINDGSTWTAVVSIWIEDNLGESVAGALVSGEWTYNGQTVADSCTTGSDGSCVVDLSGIHKRSSTATWKVLNVEDTLTYEPNDNVETSITVSKP